ncbi:DUF2637 domain-containing protein [Nocardia violaceofusca]|uniref:DUF2637 domain-containing protein n=1 Tax=Nocardia violaceofusca TaxID=941182 RepID=UPI0007A53D41|nr:DUF2637 domain-containing protein [Nocardia violaceofusca]
MPAPDTVVRTPTSPSVPDRAHRPDRAHAFFWCVLAASATVSVTGNAVHAAVLHAPAPPIAGAVAVVPPIALLTAVHGVTVLQRKQVRSTTAHRLAVVLTVLIAAGAFWLSFTALRSLAELAGIPHNQAWLWPLIIEGSMTQATVALISITQPPHDTSATTETAAPTGPITIPDALPESSRTSADDIVRTPEATFADTTTWSEIAAVICARDPARRRDPDEVAQILALHYAEGLKATEIAERTHRSRSTVSRILSRAQALNQPTT